jgi:hypothetical protein
MKQLGETVQEFVQLCPSKELIESITNAAEEFGDDVNLSEIFGGDFFLIETIEDVYEIPVMGIDTQTGEWQASNLGTLPSVFDSCEPLDNGQFIHILNCTNNAGGNTYLVPKEIADKVPNIQKSIELTKNAYN